MTLNSSGVRDIDRNLGISTDTVISELKKIPLEVKPSFSSFNDEFSDLEIEIRTATAAEADEFWSYAGNKGNQRWMWYAIERKSGIILT